jgi:uncharacterized protein (TIGR02265 family)
VVLAGADELAELTQHLTRVPAHATVKGMFISGCLDSVERLGCVHSRGERFLPFRDYPLTKFMAFMLESVGRVWPDLSPREGLRRLGQLAYPTFASSLSGRVLMAVAGSDWQSALPLTRRAYELSLSHVSVTIRDFEEKSVVLEFRDIWNFADSYQVGVMEGALKSYNMRGSVRAERLARPCDVNLHMSWE